MTAVFSLLCCSFLILSSDVKLSTLEIPSVENVLKQTGLSTIKIEHAQKSLDISEKPEAVTGTELKQQRKLNLVFICISILFLGLLVATSLALNERRKAQKKLVEANLEIHEINKKLKEIIEERDHLLKLRDVQIEEYAFTNAHELRGPIARILGLIQLLDMEKIRKGKEAQVILTKLKIELKSLDDVVHKINDFLNR
jgi:signal transduction histidine kinase